MSNHRIGFWSVFAIVVGSQVGTGVFITPISLAPYGAYALIGWIIAGIGAIALALVFSGLCTRFPQTGGAHVYVAKAFGSTAGFFVGWTYWVISWVSTTAVVTACIGYLTPIIGEYGKEVYLALEIALLAAITLLNLKGVDAAGKMEFVLSLLKFIPLLIVPIAALPYFDINNLAVDSKTSELPLSNTLGQVTLLTLWGFIGLECTTTAAGSVENPGKIIPRAVVLGTATVAAIYLLNSIGVMGLIGGSELVGMKAPYVDAAERIFGGHMAIVISLIACVICVGTLNAWMLVSGQIVLGLAETGLMPAIFAKRNDNEAPAVGLITSALGILPLLVLTSSDSLATQVTLIIDFSVSAFLFVYLACCLAFFKIRLGEGRGMRLFEWIFAIIATIFCSWIIYETPIKTLLIAALFSVSGLPLYWFWYRRGAACEV